MLRYVAIACVAVLSIYLFRFFFDGGPTIDSLLHDVGMGKELDHHRRSKMFQPHVIRVTEGVHVAVGYAIANSIMLEGPDGLVIVDTTEGYRAAKQIQSAFRNISSKPIKAIVYTHSHSDHVTGTRAFIEDSENPPEIWAHHTMPDKAMQRIMIGHRIYRGAAHQFGVLLGSYLANCGIGAALKQDDDENHYPIMPTRLIYRDFESVLIAGINITFLHIPGETPDQIGLWLPDRGVLIPADDIYETFPNLYAIRGTAPRDVMQWANSLDKMRKLHSSALVPCHTLPVLGEKQIYDLFTVYISGIKFVHDQTIRFINLGLHPEEIARKVKLPLSITSHSYWQEFYGKATWASKGVYENYLGWFSGDPVELLPLTPSEKAQKMVELVGVRGLLRAAEKALNQGDLQWGLELSSHVFKIDGGNEKAKSIRLRALKELAGRENNPLARNYYLTAALDDHGLIEWNLDRKPFIKQASIPQLFQLMKFRLKADEVEGVNSTAVFHFTDTDEIYRLQILYSVLDVEQLHSMDDVRSGESVMETSTSVWREILTRERSPLMAYWNNDIRIEGGLFSYRRFMSYFDRNN